MNRRHIALFASVCLLAGAIGVAACSDDAQVVLGTGSGGAGAGGNSGGNPDTGGNIFAGGNNPGCLTNDDCNGGVCNNGECCATVDQVCGDICCMSTDVCLWDKCITPGDDCVSEADCPPDHYCEPSLGSNMGQGGMGANCTQPLERGKCLPKPDICGEGGGGQGGAGGSDCVELCEFRPQAGLLNATIKWQWGYDPAPVEFTASADVWATPTVARIFDANCDGSVDLADPPNVVFVSGDSQGTYCSNSITNGACKKGVLRMLDGKSGDEIWSLDRPSMNSQGFAGLSVAIGDVDQDQLLDIVALSGEGNVVVVDGTGVVKHISTGVVDGATSNGFGWGGGLALGDMDNDGWPEIAYGATVYTMANNTLSLLFQGTLGMGGIANRRITHFADLDGNGDLELVTGRTAYHHDGSVLWDTGSFDGFTAIGDFDGDTNPEVVVVNGGQIRILEGLTGVTELGPVAIPGNGNGGPPTVADFDGDNVPEIGVAKQNLYSVLEADYNNTTITPLWWQTNHDNSSSLTGSSVFDFEGDGKAEVIYNDECFLWVYDGQTGDILYTTNTQSFTATEASIVADVDGDGHAEILMISNAANPTQWSCSHHVGNDSYPAWALPSNAPGYRGITVLADAQNSWVGTRTLWNQHAYSVTNICDPRDGACDLNTYYGQIAPLQRKNWQLPWLNNFRQNVQDVGVFDAPDASVLLDVDCTDPVAMRVKLRNLGQSGLPDGVQVDIYRLGSPDTRLGTVYTTRALAAGQTEVIPFTASQGAASTSDSFQARIFIDPNNITFNECRDDNNDSPVVTPQCVQ
jgi:hypothetical protein